MKKVLFLWVALLGLSHVRAQDDPLAAMLPNGKIVHFQTEEQKAKFLAARERMAAAVSQPPAATAAPVAVASTSNTQPVTNSATSSTGKVNVSAPTFTADYYLFAPETWVDKPATISVAYIRHDSTASRSDGLVELEGHTYGIQQATGEQKYGGTLSIVATPAAAQRIITLAGTNTQSNGWMYKTTLLKGIFKKSEVGKKGYFVFVDK